VGRGTPHFCQPTSLFASNVTLRTAIAKVFQQTVAADAVDNPRRRLDLLFLPNSTRSAVATEDINSETRLAMLRKVLRIEVKKGGSKIGREEMTQAEGYVDDLLHCGLLDGQPHVQAFVVGRAFHERTMTVKTIGEPAQGRIPVVTVGQLIRTANTRLFHLRDNVQERDPGSSQALLERIMAQPAQLDLQDCVRPSNPSDSPQN
jgi:hypothetical protein